MRVEAALNELENSQNSYSRKGLWPGRVEATDDPIGIGRLRVRIFHLHGDKRSTPTTALPWALVLSRGGGGYDYGEAGAIYPIGSTVMCSFYMGDDRLPIVEGGIHGVTLRDDQNPVEFLTSDGSSESGVPRSWLPPEGNEIPKDIFEELAPDDRHPTRTVWHKSYKGHTILVEDRDGFEFLKIIDRAGQVIELNSPVTEDANDNNGEQRGNRNASDDTQIPQSSLVNNRGFIRIKDVGGQEILLDGAAGNEKIVIKSTNRQGSTTQTLTLSSAKGREKIELLDKQGNKLVIDPNSAKESITLEDSSGNKLAWNPEDGFLDIIAKVSERHTTPNYEADISQNSTVQVGGSDSQTVLGNKMLQVMNDMTAAVNGMTSLVFGGAVQATIANTPANGVPPNTALSVELALGGATIRSQINAAAMTFATLAGDIDINTLAGNAYFGTSVGNVEISVGTGDLDLTIGAGNLTMTTGAGDVTLGTTAGNLSVLTSAGNADIGTDAGATTLHGSLGIALGTAAAFNITRAEPTAAALNTIAATGAADVRVCMGVPVPPVAWPALVGVMANLTNPSNPSGIHSQLGAVRNTTI